MSRKASVSAHGLKHLAVQRTVALLTLVLAMALAGMEALADEVDDLDAVAIDEQVRYAVVVEEIVVVGERDSDKPVPYERLLADPLRERIIEEIRELQLLREEFAWRRETAVLTISPPRLRWGYDPRDAARSEALFTAAALPLDLVSPAPVIRFDF